MIFCKEVIKNIPVLLSNNEFCDVTIKCEEKEFSVHKVILASASDYFRKLFTIDMKERCQSVIEIKAVTPLSLESCIKYIYTNEINICDENITEILNAAAMFQIESLKSHCIDFIKTTAFVNNCILFYQLTKIYCDEDLVNKMKREIYRHAKFLLSDMEKYNVDLEILQLILTADETAIEDEYFIFNSLIKWVELDKENRSVYFCELYQLIRLWAIEWVYLEYDIYMRNEHAGKNGLCEECKGYTIRSMAHRKDSGYASLTPKDPSKYQLLPYQVDFRNTGLRDNGSFVFDVDNNVFRIYTTEGQTVKKFNIPKVRDHSIQCLFIHQDKLYCFGVWDVTFQGKNKSQHALFCCYSSSKNSWTKAGLSAMPSLKCDEIIKCGSKVLFIDGVNEETKVNKVQSFDLFKHDWCVLPSLNHARNSMCSAVLGEYAYAIGGCLGQGPISNKSIVERFNFQTITWERIADLNKGRSCAAATTYRHEIFVIAGIDERVRISSVETYNETTKVWTEANSVNWRRGNSKAFVMEDVMYVYGGYGNIGQSRYERYSPQNGKWKESEEKDD